MDIIRTASDMQSRALALRAEGRRIGLVPTMGFLHEAHLSLVRLAREQAEVTVVSSFVNPTQFGPNEDLDRYPRDEARDRELCRKEGVDIFFIPTVEEMYAEEPRVFVDEDHVSHLFEGASRPGHFRGVLTVVAKLFNIVLPHTAVFGQKDAQQLHLLRRLVRDLKFPIEIVAGPIVREADGLAMSSRNIYLSEVERRDALCLSRGLERARELYAAGERDAAALKETVADIVAAAEHARLDYVEVVDEETFTAVGHIERPARMVMAAFVGPARLIDNIALE